MHFHKNLLNFSSYQWLKYILWNQCKHFDAISKNFWPHCALERHKKIVGIRFNYRSLTIWQDLDLTSIESIRLWKFRNILIYKQPESNYLLWTSYFLWHHSFVNFRCLKTATKFSSVPILSEKASIKQINICFVSQKNSIICLTLENSHHHFFTIKWHFVKLIRFCGKRWHIVTLWDITRTLSSVKTNQIDWVKVKMVLCDYCAGSGGKFEGNTKISDIPYSSYIWVQQLTRSIW